MGKPLTWAQRWVVPEVYPVVAVLGTALSLCIFAMGRNLSINPDVRINKDDRAAGVLENYSEGKAYKDHGFRRYLKDVKPSAFSRYFRESKNINVPPKIENNLDCKILTVSWKLMKLSDLG
ncbi:unnamed protein product [Sphagnum jensenii]